MENKEFVKLLDKMKEIHSKKNEDYASVGFFENFDRQATLIGWFRNDTDKAFVGCIGIKLARLATLLDSGRQPNNESIEDSFIDLCTYTALWASYHATMKAELFIKNHTYEEGMQQNFCKHCALHRSSHK